MAEITEQTAVVTLPYSDVLPGAVLEGCQNGLVVAPDKLVEFARYLRDNEGYDYLLDGHQRRLPRLLRGASTTSTASRSQRTSGAEGSPDRQKANPQLPSLVSVWPGADFQEREVYDMMGIRFTGTRTCAASCSGRASRATRCARTTEPYYEEDIKPFKSRHPEGHHLWAEDRVPWKDNVSYPVDWDPDLWTEPTVQYRRIMGVDKRSTGDRDQDRPRVWSTSGRSIRPPTASSAWWWRSKARRWWGWSPRWATCTANHEKIGERNT